jgi:hypothetical protein
MCVNSYKKLDSTDVQTAKHDKMRKKNKQTHSCKRHSDWFLPLLISASVFGTIEPGF